MRTSVIVLSWNGMAYLEDCLDAVVEQSYPDLQIVVVDNASNDGSASFVERRYPEVRLIRNDRNLGFAAGNNVGLRAADGELLVLLNQDAVVQPHWLGELADSFADAKVGVAGCKILRPDGRTIEHAGGYFTWPLGLAFHHGDGETDQGQYDELRKVEYVTAAAMAIRRSTLQHVGLLDEGFYPGYFEDLDYCRRARESGYDVVCVPGARVVHEGSSSFSRTVQGKPYAVFRGRFRYILKHYDPAAIAEQFVPFQLSRLPQMGGHELRALTLGCTDAQMMWPSIVGARQLDDDAFDRVARALRELADSAVLQERETFT
jgi:GT2 family glycosyltransferase